MNLQPKMDAWTSTGCKFVAKNRRSTGSRSVNLQPKTQIGIKKKKENFRRQFAKQIPKSYLCFRTLTSNKSSQNQHFLILFKKSFKTLFDFQYSLKKCVESTQNSGFASFVTFFKLTNNVLNSNIRNYCNFCYLVRVVTLTKVAKSLYIDLGTCQKIIIFTPHYQLKIWL